MSYTSLMVAQSPVVYSYLQCAAWSSVDLDEDMNEQGNLEDYEWSKEAIDEACTDMDNFMEYLTDTGVDYSSLSDECLGHNFWLSRNRHGAGFWDCGLGELGDRLHKAAVTFGTKDAYIGDDDLIHFQ
jgi:hypothetical protein